MKPHQNHKSFFAALLSKFATLYGVVYTYSFQEPTEAHKYNTQNKNVEHRNKTWNRKKILETKKKLGSKKSAISDTLILSATKITIFYVA